MFLKKWWCNISHHCGKIMNMVWGERKLRWQTERWCNMVHHCELPKPIILVGINMLTFIDFVLILKDHTLKLGLSISPGPDRSRRDRISSKAKIEDQIECGRSGPVLSRSVRSNKNRPRPKIVGLWSGPDRTEPTKTENNLVQKPRSRTRPNVVGPLIDLVRSGGLLSPTSNY